MFFEFDNAGSRTLFYKLYFYTAANSAYAKMVIDILKLEMVNGFSQNPNTLKLIDNNFQ